MLGWVDPKCQLVRQPLSARQTFFQDLRALTRYLLFDAWEGFLDFMIEGLELVVVPNSS